MHHSKKVSNIHFIIHFDVFIQLITHFIIFRFVQLYLFKYAHTMSERRTKQANWPLNFNRNSTSINKMIDYVND